MEISAPIITELTFTFEGFYCRIVPEVVTYRIAQFAPALKYSTAETGDIFHCVMVGTDGSVLDFYLSEDDLFHNMQLVERHIPAPELITDLAA